MKSTCGGDSGKLVLQEDEIKRKLQRTLDATTLSDSFFSRYQRYDRCDDSDMGLLLKSTIRARFTDFITFKALQRHEAITRRP